MKCHAIVRSASRLSLISSVVLVASAAVSAGQAAETDRWLHVRVDNHEAQGEMVRINVPLSMAEKVLPTIHNRNIHNGRMSVDAAHVNGVDLHALLEAVRAGKDGEYVTVEGQEGHVRVVKQGGYLLVHVLENKPAAKNRVEIRMPMKVVDALLSSGNEELDLVAGVRALAGFADTELVSVKNDKNTVRIWLDSKNTD